MTSVTRVLILTPREKPRENVSPGVTPLLTVECAEVSSLGREDSGLDLGIPFRLQTGGQREEYRPLVRRSPGGKTAQLERDAPDATMR